MFFFLDRWIERFFISCLSLSFFSIFRPLGMALGRTLPLLFLSFLLILCNGHCSMGKGEIAPTANISIFYSESAYVEWCVHTQEGERRNSLQSPPSSFFFLLREMEKKRALSPIFSPFAAYFCPLSRVHVLVH